ncbi:MAG: CPBP family intramembrane metalloprotease [Candidatus Gracilibacteria bacterium]|nr:CPBP family intramembrane metalloprotease [Candidatus Gracilibacteria bacterium]
MKTIKLENIKSTWKWLLIATFIPLIYTSILYLLGIYFFPFTPSTLLKTDNIPYAIIMILLSVTFEEIGWRGYLYKYCTAEGWLKMNISISILWTVWHLPAIFYGGYPLPSPELLGFALFFINLSLASFILGWLRWKTGGVLSPILVHGSHNITMSIFALTGPLLSECGIFFTIFLAITIVLIKAWKAPTFFELNVIKEKYLG